MLILVKNSRSLHLYRYRHSVGTAGCTCRVEVISRDHHVTLGLARDPCTHVHVYGWHGQLAIAVFLLACVLKDEKVDPYLKDCKQPSIPHRNLNVGSME